MKMHEKKLKKFNIYKKIANVLFVVVVVLGALLITAGIGVGVYLASVDYDLVALANKILLEAVPEATMALPTDMEISVGLVFMVVLYAALGMALMAYIIKAVANMFGNIVETRTPFTESTVRSLKSMGIALLVYAGILFVLGIVSGMLIPYPANMNVDFDINGSSIFFGILLLSLSEIFNFGLSLQQDSESIV